MTKHVELAGWLGVEMAPLYSWISLATSYLAALSPSLATQNMLEKISEAQVHTEVFHQRAGRRAAATCGRALAGACRAQAGGRKPFFFRKEERGRVLSFFLK